jgi:hypothetical protein
MSWSVPAIARHDPAGVKGVFFGYDFHVAQSSFGLTEINTHAGGAMLNAVLAREPLACCAAAGALLPLPPTAVEFEASIVTVFRSEWALAKHARPLRSIAIVDEYPDQQYLYPGFPLFQRLFLRHGLLANFCTPGGGFAPVYEGPADGHAGWTSKGCMPAQRESRLFLLDDNTVQELDHERRMLPGWTRAWRGRPVAPEFSDLNRVVIRRRQQSTGAQH